MAGGQRDLLALRELDPLLEREGHLRGVHSLVVDGQLEAARRRDDGLEVRHADVAAHVGEDRREDHVDRDGLPVEELLIVQHRHLELHREDVPKVDEPLEGVLPQVGRELLEHRLDGEVEHASRGDGAAGVSVLELAVDQLLAMVGEQLVQLAVLDQRHLEDLGSTVGELSLVEGAEEGAVEQRERRRQVGAELILVADEVDACLRTDARVNIPHHRRRHADVRRATAVDGGSEADDVHAHASSDGDDGVEAAVDAEVVDGLGDLEHHVHVLVLLVRRQH
mmetsp:Transcript_90496/g.255862  ORF Transcript_90496/g.255862 Transcript_90496/m.255862 type:complete len:280 (+) Transcript_90496:266-1105(+)